MNGPRDVEYRKSRIRCSQWKLIGERSDLGVSLSVQSLFVIVFIASIIVNLVVFASAGEGGPVSGTTENGSARLTTSVDHTSAQIAEQLSLTLTAIAPQGVTIKLPQPAKKLGEFEVVDVKDAIDIPVAEGRQWTRVYKLESLASGELEIPALTVTLTDRRHGAPRHDTLQSQPIPIRIASVLEGRADPLKFRDIKGVVDLPSNPQSSPAWAVWLLGGAVAFALAAIAAIIVLKKRHRQPPADRWALAELQRLEESQLCLRGDFHELYFRLSEIIRGYVERQFGIAAPKWTTAEFMEQMRNNKAFETSQRAALAEFLAAADLVKFACVEPSGEEVTAAFSKARDFIQQASQSKTSQVEKEAA